MLIAIDVVFMINSSPGLDVSILLAGGSRPTGQVPVQPSPGHSVCHSAYQSIGMLGCSTGVSGFFCASAPSTKSVKLRS